MRKKVSVREAPVNRKPDLVKPSFVLEEFRWYGAYNLRKLPKPVGKSTLGYVCMASWEVLTSDLEKLAFQQVSEEIGNVRRLYHGTKAHHVSSITQRGLQTGESHCMFGRGIYVGQWQKAWRYALASRYSGIYMLEVDVVLGVSKVAEEAGKHSLKSLRAEGCHSVHGKAGVTKSWSGTLRNDEWVVYSTDQVLVRYVHEYQEVRLVQPEEAKSRSCQVVRIPQVWDTKGKKAFLDVLTKPRACGGSSYQPLRVVGGGEVWVCATCVAKHKLRTGDKIQVMDDRGVPVHVKIKG